MAQKTVVTMTDDIDGTEATETVVFGLDGASYEIDLNDAHAEDLRKVLAPFISVARRPGGRPSATPHQRSAAKSSAAKSSTGSPDAKAVRAWAKENGIEVNTRGRLNSEVLAKYEAANR